MYPMKHFLKYNRAAQICLITFIVVSILAIALTFTAYTATMGRIIFLCLHITVVIYMTLEVTQKVTIGEEGITAQKYLVKKTFIPWSDVTSISIEENPKLRRRNKTSMVQISAPRSGEGASTYQNILVQFRPEVINAIAETCSLPIHGITDLVNEGCLDVRYEVLEHREAL